MNIARMTTPRWASLGGVGGFDSAVPTKSPLQELSGFGQNPGNLAAKLYIPDALAPGAPLVVVLHGCTQSAAGYDHGTGWSDLAARHGFAVLFPEQRRANNANMCFNWFEPEDMQRGGGEPASIRQMIDHVVRNHQIDATRIFVTGLSAGAAMAGIMLATYPEVFAGGGLIAGLPYGVAKSIPEAMQRMRRGGHDSDAALGVMVQHASDHDGPWPRISIWHGTSDLTVNMANADATVAQWLAVHALVKGAAVADVVDGYPRRLWRNADGIVAVEHYSITGMGHGTPLDPGSPDGCGKSGAFLLDAGISSTQHLAQFWGLADHTASRDCSPETAATPPITERSLRPSQTTLPVSGTTVQKIIEDALRSAGLMR
jgi:poly(hydroxyalkanoate) depolymerase family esterase